MLYYYFCFYFFRNQNENKLNIWYNSLIRRDFGSISVFYKSFIFWVLFLYHRFVYYSLTKSFSVWKLRFSLRCRSVYIYIDLFLCFLFRVCEEPRISVPKEFRLFARILEILGFFILEIELWFFFSSIFFKSFELGYFSNLGEPLVYIILIELYFLLLKVLSYHIWKLFSRNQQTLLILFYCLYLFVWLVL